MSPWVAVDLDLDQFASHGYLRLPGALDGDLVADWAQSALPRLRDRPFELKDAVPPAQTLATIDPDDPATWRWRRATLRGADRARIAEVAPDVLATVGALVGGVDRVATRHITDYLIMAFPQRGLRRLLPARLPNPRRGSWHLDDPGPAMRLTGWRNAILLIVLFSDIDPGGGGPVLACDSPAHVARLLAGSDGVDFVDRTATREIVSRCSRIEEVTGRAGDVLVCHPFLLHCPSANRSRRLRVLANPMLQVVDELDFANGTSPLEQVTRGWLA